MFGIVPNGIPVLGCWHGLRPYRPCVRVRTRCFLAKRMAVMTPALCMKTPVRFPRPLLFFVFISLALWFSPPPCPAHNVGSGLVGQQMRIQVDPGTFQLDYTIEIPTSVWIDAFQGDPRAQGPETSDPVAEFSARLMSRVQLGLILMWNRNEIPLERLQGVLEKSGLKDYNFFQYRLTLRGTFPKEEPGTIILINRNYSGFQNVYAVSLTVSPAYRLEETNLEEPGQRFLLDAQTGQPWSLWEGLRSIQIRLRPAPFWRSLAGEGEPVRVDFQKVYRKTLAGDGKGTREYRKPAGEPPESAVGRLKALLTQEDPDAGILIVALSLAFFLGAIHALSPGHGKALVGAYLIGSQGRPLDAVTLGLVVTLSHVSSVILLGVASLAASRTFVPETMFPYIEMASALLLMVLGIWMLRTRWPGSRHTHGPHDLTGHVHSAQGHEHGGGHVGHDPHGGREHAGPVHQHSHEHEHDHMRERIHVRQTGQDKAGASVADSPAGQKATRGKGARWKELLSLGISGGMVPCPSALAILLIAIALQKIAFGICIIVAFSLGLASVLVTVGLLLVWSRSFLGPRAEEAAWLAWLPVVSSLVVFLLGLFMLIRALLQQGPCV
jgi:ABC-type nickel/cobalt efflux system permease component RcnA